MKKNANGGVSWPPDDEPFAGWPEFVVDPGIDLGTILDGQPVLPQTGGSTSSDHWSASFGVRNHKIDAQRREIRKGANQSWSNLRKTVLSLQGKTQEAFGTSNVKATTGGVVRRIARETGRDPATLKRRLTAMRR